MSNSHSPQPAVPPETELPEFWIERYPGACRVILEPPAVNAYNQKVLQCLCGTVYDLTGYPPFLAKTDLTAMISENRFPEGPVYGGGELLTSGDFSRIRENLNLAAIPEINPVAYGFTLRRANLRSFPVAVSCTAEPDDVEFDLFQETALNPAEPLLILYQSSEKNWRYIQTANCRGWVAAKDIVAADSRQSWLAYFQNRRFLVVNANQLKVACPDEAGISEELHFEMGAKLPLEDPGANCGDFRVKIPVSDATGRLRFQTVRIPRVLEINPGYLPYTGANIITQAFKMLGARYGWGWARKNVDCSSFIMNVYRSFGFEFPRSSREQERLPGKTVHFESRDQSDRAGRLRRLLPGAILNFPGHVMLYLGEYNGSDFIIHALSSYGVPDSRGGYAKTYLLKVCVTGLDLIRSNGKTLLASLTSGRNVG